MLIHSGGVTCGSAVLFCGLSLTATSSRPLQLDLGVDEAGDLGAMAAEAQAMGAQVSGHLAETPSLCRSHAMHTSSAVAPTAVVPV